MYFLRFSELSSVICHLSGGVICLSLKKVDSIFTLKFNNSISVRNPLTLLPAEVDLFS